MPPCGIPYHGCQQGQASKHNKTFGHSDNLVANLLNFGLRILLIGQGTNFDVKIPWIIGESGYQTKLNGTLMMIEATTSLPFRDLLRSETLQINVDCNYPMKWNAYQVKM